MSITAINHLAFITPDLPATIRFYRDLLGMELFGGIGHDGYRHYFFKFGDNQIAFFQYAGARAMERKFHGVKTDKPLGFDHVSLTVSSCAELFGMKDRLEAAGVEVVGPIDHGFIWSIYFFDPNNIPLEVSWEILEVTRGPIISEDAPVPEAEEGTHAQPEKWPAVETPTPPERWIAKAGNGHAMREAALREGRAHPTEEYLRVLQTSGVKP